MAGSVAALARPSVFGDAVQRRVLAGEQRGPARRARGGARVVAVQLAALRAQALAGGELRAAELGQRLRLVGRRVPLLVGHDEEHVRTGGHRHAGNVAASAPRPRRPPARGPGVATSAPTARHPSRVRWMERSTSRSRSMPPGCGRVVITQRSMRLPTSSRASPRAIGGAHPVVLALAVEHDVGAETAPVPVAERAGRHQRHPRAARVVERARGRPRTRSSPASRSKSSGFS